MLTHVTKRDAAFGEGDPQAERPVSTVGCVSFEDLVVPQDEDRSKARDGRPEARSQHEPHSRIVGPCIDVDRR